MSIVLQDLRHGLRVLLKNPRFTTLAVLTLALGIGGSTAIFSVVEARLLRPLPFDRPEDLVWVMQTDEERGWDRNLLSGPNFTDLRADATSFEHMAASRGDDKTVLVAGNPAERVQFLLVTPEVFPMLGIQATEGRVWDAGDSPASALISDRFRRAHFGENESVVGRTLKTEDGVYEVVGVLPDALQFPPGPPEVAADVWAPLDLGAPRWLDRATTRLIAYGRLREGVTLAQARTELEAVANRLSEAYPETNAGVGVNLGPLAELWYDSLRQESPLLLTAVGFVLLIGCANIANLQLVRLSSRRSEMSLRIALGASRSRLIGQLLTESLLLAAAGWAVGLPLAYWATSALAAMTPPMTALVGQIEIDGRVLAFSMLATLFSGLFFGTLPALATPARALAGKIRAGGQALLGGRSRLRSTLIAAEITLSLVSLVAAGLMTRALAKAVSESPGFNPDGLLTFRIAGPPEEARDSAASSVFYPDLAERLAALPGVRSVAFANRMPMRAGGGATVWFDIGGQSSDPSSEPSYAEYRMASPDYFRTMQTPLLEGRHFDARDNASSPRVAIVNLAFVQRFLDGQSSLGRTLVLRDEFNKQRKGDPAQIVGVVAGEKYWRLDMQPQPEIYVPFAQDPTRTVDLAVRTAGDAGGLIAAIRDEVAAVDPARPLFEMQLMEQRIESALATPRFSTALLALFALLGLILAAVGVYGVMAQGVAERAREIGLRSALGANRAQLQRLVLGAGHADDLRRTRGRSHLLPCGQSASAPPLRLPRRLAARPRYLRHCSRRAARRRSGGLLPACPARRPHRADGGSEKRVVV